MEDFEENDEMAALMGFSAFSETPKTGKKRKSDNPHYDASKEEQGSGSNNIPLGQPRERLPAASSHPPDSARTPMSSHLPNAVAVADSNATGLTASQGPHPVLAKSMEELTDNDLFALKKGVPDGEGRIVYFQKSFVEEDPWARLKHGKSGGVGGGKISS
ncbi:hypothetical protein BT63DRAFT_460100 [Microthyrium microscopicum]|uniref:Uncharacterized protein n=1 Tax=Microthyrium microscopicum TaxID=703497 RepID=A0A6A6U0G6_9PEZI|nr:hypothetical protein BT63DRAFT_460100 [Microthyrium microscopicum]